MQTPSDYQVTALNWLLTHTRGILADEPGVGKTLPTILAAQQYEGRKLVVAPAYLAFNWLTELERSGEQGIAISGSPKAKQAAWAQQAPWTIMSYELFARKDWLYDILQVPWSVVIFDEAHRLRGRNSKRSESAYELRKRGKVDFIWMLTGTPIVSNGGDVFPLLRICAPREFTSYWRFVENYCRVTVTPWAKVVGKPRNQEEFTKVLSPYMLRRTLEACLPDIPESVETLIEVEVPGAVRKRINEAKLEYRVQYGDKFEVIGAGGLVSTLRSLTVDTKVEALLDLLEDVPEGEQVVVFAWYRETVHKIASAVKDCVYFTGENSIGEREVALKRFTDGQVPYLVASIGTVQEGINLQNARYAVFIEEDWLGAINEQAVARLRRRGQERIVLKYVINAKQTIDGSVHRRQAKRLEMNLKEVFDEVMNDR